MNFKNKLSAVSAILLLLAACESAPNSGGNLQGDAGTDGYGSNVYSGNVDSGSVMPGTQGDLEANVGDRVFFATDSSVIRPEAQSTLERQAAWLKQYPHLNVVIEGHCDERGTREYNLALGERRANAARNYLISLGVDGNRISTISYGKERPAVLGHDPEAWAQNRRAVTVIVE